MEGSLKVQALRRIFTDMSEEEKLDTFKLLLNDPKWKDIVLVEDFFHVKKCNVIEEAYKHLGMWPFWGNLQLDPNRIMWIQYSNSIRNLKITYSRSGKVGMIGHLENEEITKSFLKFCRDFFENPEYIWNQ